MNMNNKKNYPNQNQSHKKNTGGKRNQGMNDAYQVDNDDLLDEFMDFKTKTEEKKVKGNGKNNFVQHNNANKAEANTFSKNPRNNKNGNKNANNKKNEKENNELNLGELLFQKYNTNQPINSQKKPSDSRINSHKYNNHNQAKYKKNNQNFDNSNPINYHNNKYNNYLDQENFKYYDDDYYDEFDDYGNFYDYEEDGFEELYDT